MWLKEFKIALIQQDTEKLDTLLDTLPQLEDPQEIEQALYLIKEATKLVSSLRDETQSAMRQMKKNIDFLDSAASPRVSKFDVNF